MFFTAKLLFVSIWWCSNCTLAFIPLRSAVTKENSLKVSHLLLTPKLNLMQPPMAPASFDQALKGINSKDAMYFLLEMAEKTKSDTFQLLKTPFLKLYVLGDARTARDILEDETTSKIQSLYKTYNYITGARSLMSTADGVDFNTLRQALIKPVFHQPAEVQRMNESFEEYAKDWIDNKLQSLAETGQLFDPTEEMRCLFFCAYMNSAFEYKADAEDYHTWRRNLDKALPELILKRGVSPLRKYYDFFSPKTRLAKKASKDLQSFAEEILHSYRNKADTNKSRATTIIKVISDKSGPYKSDKYRVAQIVDLIIASYITSSAVVSSAMIMIAKHPDIALKLQKELVEKASATPTSPRNHQRPSNTPYLRNIMKESTRLFSPGASMNALRNTGKDFSIRDTKSNNIRMVIPKGSAVLVPSVLMCRNSDTFHDPNAFVPERWDNANTDMEDSLILFSLGTRRCPGQPLASVQTYRILELILSKYAFHIESEGNFQFNGLMSSFYGARLYAKRID
jgi:cytochrome P450